MRSALAVEDDEEKASSSTPFLSHSRVNRYLHCPEQYRLYYVENLRRRFPPANLVFGQIVHEALAYLFRDGGDPVPKFLEAWQVARDTEITYSKRDSWERLRHTGEALLEKFVRNELPKIGNVTAVEKRFELEVTSMDLPFVGVVDLVADLEGQRTVVDFKTSGSAYAEYEAVLSDQLTAYQLACPEAARLSLCVFVKTKERGITWLPVRRTPDQLGEYLAKLGHISGEITSGRFFKRPGKWCSWCDFLPVCLGNRDRAEETLIRIR